MTITNDLEQIDESYLQTLIDNSVGEGKNIEYKQSLPGNTDNDKKEFLADVSSFANANGGTIFYGISENSSSGTPEALLGLEIQNSDSEINRLDNILRTGIEPRIPSFHIKSIPLNNSKAIIAIQTAKSWISPHRVTFKGHDKFYSRSSNGKYPLAVTELRVAFNLSETITEKIKNFKDSRISNIVADDTPVPLKENARIVLQLIPLNAFIPGQKHEIIDQREAESKLAPFFGRSGWSGRYNFDGYLTFTGTPENKFRSYTQFFRNGIIEAVDSHIIRSRTTQEQTTEKLIPSSGFEEELIHSLYRYMKFQESYKIELPIIVFVTLIGVKGYKMALRHNPWHDELPAIDKDLLNLPEVMIENYETKSEHILLPCINAVWNACGFEKSHNFDENNNWTKPS
ncbi:MAG: ATP-binding protein [Candidatus Omnitrophica bacterium]|nr:ATP-binding protein [Candidatus Omnitrophota bacterium]MCA9408024.1 ATP-binding protein [Candidatus Omnitrophota bacterium]